MLLRCLRSPAHLEALSLSTQQKMCWSEGGGVWVGCRRRGEGDIAGDCRGGGLSRVTFAGAAAGDLSLLQQHSHWLAAQRSYPSQDIALISIHWLCPEPGGKLECQISTLLFTCTSLVLTRSVWFCQDKLVNKNKQLLCLLIQTSFGYKNRLCHHHTFNAVLSFNPLSAAHPSFCHLISFRLGSPYSPTIPYRKVALGSYLTARWEWWCWS